MYVTQGKQGISSQLECGHPLNDYLLYRHRVQQIHLFKPQRRHPIIQPIFSENYMEMKKIEREGPVSNICVFRSATEP